MLVDKLAAKTKKINEFRRKKQENQNRVRQKSIDDSFHNLVSKSNRLINLLNLCNSELSFKIDDEVLISYENCLKDIITIISDSNIDEQTVSNMNLKLSAIETSYKNLWPTYYRELTNNLLATLEIIKSTNPTQIRNIINEIEKAKTYPLDKNILIKFSSELKNAENIINDLDLDDDVVYFLRKVNSGQANLLDLNEKIIDWLKKENLQGKIKLSF